MKTPSSYSRNWLGGAAGLLAAMLLAGAACRAAGQPSQPAAPAARPASGSPATQPQQIVPNASANAARPAAPPVTSAPDLAGELNELKAQWAKKLGSGYSTSLQSPFLLIINADQRIANYWLMRTVAPAAERLGKQFMKAQPDKATVILLFVDQKTYRQACQKVLGVESPPYFGFYRPWERLLVMDINTGGGTLVHELTHAMIAFDFPDIPDWFNEGLGSLYEQCQYRDDKLEGLPNWRLPELQKAIKNDKLGSFESLTRAQFRTGPVGLNYAHARYLCFYMQEKGCLESFYRMFRDNHKDDPTGLAFLKKAFEPKSLEDVDKDYRRWVGTLKFNTR